MDSGASNGQQLSATFLDKDQPFGRKRFGRLRRDRGNDLVISLAEDQPIGMLKQVKILGQIIGPIILAIFKFQRISLNSDERVSKLSSESTTLKVHQNGQLELIGPLNYEAQNELQLTVQIDGTHKSENRTKMPTIHNLMRHEA